MFTSDFKAYFDKLPIISKHFVGVRAIDELAPTLHVRQFIVVNMSPKHHSGSHWVLIFRSHKDTVEIFNSLGFNNLAPLRPYLKFNFKTHLTYNNTPVQLSTSSTCGLYVIYFAIFRLLNLDQSFQDIMDEFFCTDLSVNENKVTKFCQHLLTIKDESELYDF